MRRAFAFVVVFLLLAGLAGGLGYFQFKVKPEMIRGFIAKAAPPPTTVAAVEAKSTAWQSRLSAIGTFRAVLGIDVAPQVGGVVRAIRFESGQDVAKGQPLVEIDDAVEQADLQSNIAALKNADLSLDRQRQLVQGGNTPKANFDQAQAQRDQAAAAVERSRSLIDQKRILAPFAGRLGLRKIDGGQYVSPGTSIVTLQKLDPIFVDFPIPEQSFGLLSIGQDVEVNVDAYPGKVFKGRIKSIDARISPDTRNVLVRAEVPNADKALLPGMFANVGVLAGKPTQLVTLPRTTVTYSLYGDSVFIVKPAPANPGEAQAATAPADQPMVVERRFVRPGDTRDDNVAILEGVKAGEQVVAEGQLKLQPGARVKIDPTASVRPNGPRPKE
jgi:membrane fusion protein (multidrug efflux system)